MKVEIDLNENDGALREALFQRGWLAPEAARSLLTSLNDAQKPMLEAGYSDAWHRELRPFGVVPKRHHIDALVVTTRVLIEQHRVMKERLIADGYQITEAEAGREFTITKGATT